MEGQWDSIQLKRDIKIEQKKNVSIIWGLKIEAPGVENRKREAI